MQILTLTWPPATKLYLKDGFLHKSILIAVLYSRFVRANTTINILNWHKYQSQKYKDVNALLFIILILTKAIIYFLKNNSGYKINIVKWSTKIVKVVGEHSKNCWRAMVSPLRAGEFQFSNHWEEEFTHNIGRRW